MKNKHILFLNSKTGNYICTIAIGKSYYNDWKKFSKLSWIKYCKKNDIGLIIIVRDLIDKSNIYWKKPNWQKMLLGDYLKNLKEIKINNVCYLDTDILINYNSPNVFNYHKKNKITLVSEVNNLPFDLEYIKRKVSFFRNKYYSSRYKLDSAIFMNVKQKYKFQNLTPQKDYACTGLIMFNLTRFSNLMYNWFFKYKKNMKTLTGGGEEPVMNYEIFKTKKVNLINYKFQALWFYEMANNYTFLYKYKNTNNSLFKLCIEETLLNNYFLHFPGSWYEGNKWKIKNIFIDKKTIKFTKKFYKYLDKKVQGNARGRVLPK